MKWIKIFGLLTIAGAVMSCAHNGQYLPKHAFENPSECISIVHPVELEKAGIEKITTFVSIMDPGLWVEVLANGGVWPTLALLPNKIIEGYSYLANINYWGDFLFQSEFYCGKEELDQAKILHFNRDGGWIYQLSGDEVNYDPEKFDNNKGYRQEIFGKYGLTLSELNLFWIEYLKLRGVNSSSNLSCVQSISVGSPAWQEYKEKLAAKMRHNYKMNGGKIRCGYLPIEEFRRIAIENNGFTGSERFIKHAKLPLFAIPFTGIGFVAMAGINVANSAVTAGIDTDWTGSYARAKIVRHQMAPLFRQICQIYKELLKARDEEIKRLKTDLYLHKIFNEN